MHPVEKPKRSLWFWVLWILGILAVLAAVAVGILFGYNRFALVLDPVGEAETVLDYGTPYQEQGATPHFYGSKFWREGMTPDIDIRTEGSVDTARVGTYTVTYSAQYRFWKARRERTVRVVDRKQPELTLNGPSELYVLPGETYIEPGYTAWDEYDGDLTANVQLHNVDGNIVYQVTDAAGNAVTLTRIIHYDDVIPPEITLSGGDSVDIFAGKPYEEPGFTAWDNSEGDISHRVTVEGTVNRYRSGSYPLTYTVTDAYGNTSVVTRTVNVVPQPQPDTVDPEGKVIYLTFDDGPGPYTAYLLDILEKYNVKATFFVICNGYSDLIGRMADEGHAVGIHTATHDYRTIYASEEAFYNDISQVQALILAETGSETNILRFPGGSSNTVSRFNKGIMSRLTQSVREAGFQYFDWNVDSNDAGGASSWDEVYENVVNGIYGRRVAVVLQHDIKGFSVDAVESIIIWGLNNGYTFLPLDVTSPGCHHGVNN